MTATKMFWYKFFIQDYQRDTSHLTLLEHGAYRLLIDQCYLSGGLLPSDLEAVYRLARAMTKSEQAAIRTVLGAFFTRTDEGYLHGRVSREIESLNEAASAHRRCGARGGRPKKNQIGSGIGQESEPNKNQIGFENETKSVSETEPRQNQTGIQSGTNRVSQTKPKNNLSHKSEVKSQDNRTLRYGTDGAREKVFPMGSGWEPSSAFWPIAKHDGISSDTPDFGLELAEFIAFWCDKTDVVRTQAGWEKTFLESWKRHRAFAESKGKRAKLSPHSGFAERDYTVGVNPDGSF
jgi:uncharacterized protein YdaU (DUF1376 family)